MLPLKLGPNTFINIHWSRYDDSGVLHVCIEHVLIRNPDGNKEVDLAGQDAIHEALMLDDLELNGVKYKWRESTKEVYQRIEEDSPLVLVGTVLVKLWVPRQLKYIEGINGPLVQLQLMDDTDPAAPHLYKIVVANCDMYDGRNSGDYLHDVGMSIGDVIRGSAPMAMTEMAGVPRVHSTFNFSGWVRSGIAEEGVWGMTVGEDKLTVNPSFDDLKTTGKSLPSGEIVVVLQKKTLQVGARSAPVIRVRIATKDDKQGALLHVGVVLTSATNTITPRRWEGQTKVDHMEVWISDANNQLRQRSVCEQCFCARGRGRGHGPVCGHPQRLSTNAD